MSRQKGAEAEDAAAAFLESKGFRILERNFRSRFGEIDLVAKDGDAVVFVEVRSRKASSFGLARETVGTLKQGRIVKAARYYIQVKALDCPMRFDVVALQDGSFEHIEDAFDAA